MLAPIYKKRKYIEDYYELLAQIYPEFRKKYEHCMEAYDEPAT
jgi:predicted RNA-binding protein